MKKARLLFTNECNRNCKGCCNKNWNGEPAKEISFYVLDIGIHLVVVVEV